MKLEDYFWVSIPQGKGYIPKVGEWVYFPHNHAWVHALVANRRMIGNGIEWKIELTRGTFESSRPAFGKQITLLSADPSPFSCPPVPFQSPMPEAPSLTGEDITQFWSKAQEVL